MKEKYLALIAVGVLLFITSKMNIGLEVSSIPEEKDPNKEIQQHLYSFLCKLERLGAHKNLFCKDHFKKAESTYLTYLNEKTNENAQKCLKHLNDCEEAFEFFSA